MTNKQKERRDQAITCAFKSGMNVKEIGRRFSMSDANVRLIAKAQGFTTQRRGRPILHQVRYEESASLLGHDYSGSSI